MEDEAEEAALLEMKEEIEEVEEEEEEEDLEEVEDSEREVKRAKKNLIKTKPNSIKEFFKRIDLLDLSQKDYFGKIKF